MNKRYQYLLMFGHLCADINQGALPAIIPFLIAQQGLSYASAASLILASTLISSVVQPIFGYWGDQFSRPWLMSLGIVLAGGGLGAIGFCKSYGAAMTAAGISGLGIALFHPEGGKIANFASGAKKGAGIGIFAVGGNLGFVAGPVLATVALSLWGLAGTGVFVLPAVFMAGILLPFTSKFRKLSPKRVKKNETLLQDAQVDGLEDMPQDGLEGGEDDWGSFAKASLVMCCRSILYYGLMTFVPLFFISRYLQTEAAANTNLAIFSIAGVMATVIGGRVADRIGFRKIIRICFFMLPPLLLLLLQTNSNLAATLLIIPIGIVMSGAYSSLIAMSQGFLPNHIGFASGISLGLAVSTGGVCAPLIGWAGDAYGLMAAMYIIVGISFLALLLTLILPKQREG